MGAPRRLSVAALALFTLFACDSESGEGTGPVATYVRAGGDMGGDAASFEGQISLRDGCLWLVDDKSTGPLTTLPAFAEDTVTWNADARELSVGGVIVHLGDTVAVTGGESDSSQAALPGGCSGESTVFYVAPDGIRILNDAE